MEDNIDIVKEVSSSVKPNGANKQCFICENKKAEYVIKGTDDFYCKECAEDAFGDVDCLEKL